MTDFCCDLFICMLYNSLPAFTAGCCCAVMLIPNCPWTLIITDESTQPQVTLRRGLELAIPEWLRPTAPVPLSS